MPSFFSFIREVGNDKLLLVAVVAAMGMMLVNGWTDAPVSIAPAVTTGAITFFKATVMAAGMNFLGAVTVMLLGNSVAVSIYEISGFSADIGRQGAIGIIAALLSVGVWALAALYFGLPTSESHALMAGLLGSALASGDKADINGGKWIEVFLGLLLSTLPVAVLCRAAVNLSEKFSKHKRMEDKSLKRLQVLGAAVSCFAHGAQDGQKFAGVFTVLAVLCLRGSNQVEVPIWTVLLSALLISAGMLLGGARIVRSFSKFAPKEPQKNFIADAISSVALVVLAVFGIPVSTTHAKTSAILAISPKGPNRKNAVIGMCAAWGLTFPVCTALAYLFCAVLRLFFIAAR